MFSLISRNAARTVLMVLVLSACAAMASAADLNIVYEKVILDAWGNEVGTQRVMINSYEDLPLTSPWRSYLTQLVGTRTILDYTREVSKSLARPLNLLVSDRDLVSSTSKTDTGYNLNLYKHVTQFTSSDSKKFVFLHELGHVAMLNAYPSSYSFAGLNYGSDNVHYMDEILPNTKTAWVEGWANAFAANKNNGKVFNLDMNSSSIVAFLKNNTFEQMTRNELFVGKVMYDIFAQLPGGRDKSFAAMSTSGPHNSLLDFCRAYVSRNPGDQVGLARLLDQNSQGRISQAELLTYINNGSNTVSADLGAYLRARGSTVITSTGGTTTTTKTGGFWSSIGSFFKNLFGGLFGNQSAGSAVSSASSTNTGTSPRQQMGNAGNVSMSAEAPTQGVALPPVVPADVSVTQANPDLAGSHEEYLAAFAAYNDAVAKGASDSPEVKKALERMQAAKAKVQTLRRNLGHR